MAKGGSSLGIMLKYPGVAEQSHESLRISTVRLIGDSLRAARPADSVIVGFIGSGNYASQVLIPAFKGTPAILKSVASTKGVSGVHAGKKYGFEGTTTNSESVLRDAGEHGRGDTATAMPHMCVRHYAHENMCSSRSRWQLREGWKRLRRHSTK